MSGGVFSDLARAVGQKIDDEGERGLKVVPVQIVTAFPNLTVKIQGSNVAHPAVLLAGILANVNDMAYAIWWPGQVQPIVFKVTGTGDAVWHVIGAVGEPAFGSGVSALGGAYITPRFRRDAGVVRLEGLFSANGLASTSTLFTLPAGYRPSASLIQNVNANIVSGPASTGTAHTHTLSSVPARVEISAAGNVSYVGPGALQASSHLSISGVTFIAEN